MQHISTTIVAVILACALSIADAVEVEKNPSIVGSYAGVSNDGQDLLLVVFNADGTGVRYLTPYSYDSKIISAYSFRWKFNKASDTLTIIEIVPHKGHDPEVRVAKGKWFGMRISITEVGRDWRREAMMFSRSELQEAIERLDNFKAKSAKETPR